MQTTFNNITFSDDDVVNLDNWIPAGDYNPHNVRPWLLHDHGFTVAIVFASCEQDALEQAADADKLSQFLIQGTDIEDYGDDAEGITPLGNAGEPFNIESLGIIELPNPKRSFVAQFEQRHK